MLPAFFIVNPHSGKKDIRKLIPLIREHFEAAKIPFEIRLTQGPNDARKTASEIASSHPIVVAVGGDGTVNEVLNGIVNTGCILGLLPIGSGNDFSKAAGYPSDFRDCLNVLSNQRHKFIDLGLVSAATDVAKSDQRYFVNSCGVGLDAVVANEAGKIPWIRGVMKYTIAASRVLFRYHPGHSVVTAAEFSSEGKHLLISVGNGTCSGGGFYLTPDALLDDGVFDVCLAKDVSITEVLKILPFVFAGKHGRFKKVSILRTNKLKVISETDLVVHVDGEILGRDLREVNVELLPRALKLIVP